MPAADHREVGDRIQLEQERTGEMEEISHHQVGCPRLLQFGKTVKNIKGVFAFLLDQVVDIHRKSLKPVGELHGNNAYAFLLRQNRRMLGKAHIDQFLSFPDDLLRKSRGKQAEFLKGRHLPHDVVPQADGIQSLIHSRDAGINSVKSCHTVSLSFVAVLCAVIFRQRFV